MILKRHSPVQALEINIEWKIYKYLTSIELIIQPSVIERV